ncbi:MAG TPA: hypothetical protein VMD09_02095 [Solirubrobacteraceae bacterium]|nr:hypothetical protein [Solirubrobacteraceae bacterium]
MPEPSESGSIDELEGVVDRLRAERAQADPLQLDRIKRMVMARSPRQRQGSLGFMKSRFATVFTLVALVGGTGGAIAIGASGSANGPQGGAASAQYCNGKAGPCKPPPPKHNCGRYGRQRCPSKPKHCYYWSHNRRHEYKCSAGEKAGTGYRRPKPKHHYSKKSHVKAIAIKRDPGSLTG